MGKTLFILANFVSGWEDIARKHIFVLFSGEKIKRPVSKPYVWLSLVYYLLELHPKKYLAAISGHIVHVYYFTIDQINLEETEPDFSIILVSI